MKIRCLFSISFLMISLYASSQSFTLSECQELAKANYPLIKKQELIQKTKDYDVSNIIKAYYPQFSLSAKASYQTEVTSIPVAIPGVENPPKDQYNVALELNQVIWDGGATRAQKKSIESRFEVDKNDLETNLYALNERINNLFFGILLLNRQLVQNDIMEKELLRNLKNIENYILGGIASISDKEAMEVEIMNNNQQKIELNTTKEAYLKMLSFFTGKEISSVESPELVLPSLENSENKRPELQLFSSMQNNVEVQRIGISAKNMPKISLFLQGAYGNPGLDMLKNGFTPYAIGGIRLSWNISSFYTLKKDIAKINVQKQTIENNREIFLFNTDLNILSYKSDIEKILKQMDFDDKIIELRANIKKSVEVKVENGIMNVSDLIHELNLEQAAKNNKSLREMQLLILTYKIKNTLND